jgi:hypothetical protein
LVRLHGLKGDLAGAGRWGRGIDMPAFSASRSIMFGAGDRNRTRAVRDTNAVPGQRGRHWPACGSDYCHSSQHGDRLSVIGIPVKKELIKISKRSLYESPVADTSDAQKSQRLKTGTSPLIERAKSFRMGTPSVAPLLRCFAFVLAARRPATPLYLCHPRRGPAAALPSSTRQAFDCDDGFLDLCALLAQVGEHLQDVHAGRIAQSSTSRKCSRALLRLGVL